MIQYKLKVPFSLRIKQLFYFHKICLVNKLVIDFPIPPELLGILLHQYILSFVDLLKYFLYPLLEKPGCPAS